MFFLLLVGLGRDVFTHYVYLLRAKFVLNLSVEVSVRRELTTSFRWFFSLVMRRINISSHLNMVQVSQFITKLSVFSSVSAAML